MDTMDLRVNLLAHAETANLAPEQDASLLAAQYAAGSIIASLDTAIRVEVAFQAEMTRWLKGLPPSTRVERLQADLSAARLGHANGKAQTPVVDAYQATATEVPTPAPLMQSQEFASKEEADRAIAEKVAEANGAVTPSP